MVLPTAPNHARSSCLVNPLFERKIHWKTKTGSVYTCPAQSSLDIHFHGQYRKISVHNDGRFQNKKEGLVLLKIFPLSVFLLFFLMSSCGIKSKPTAPEPLSKDPGKTNSLQLEEQKAQPKEKPEKKKDQNKEKGKSP